jgi:hypothetical protein
MAVAFAVPSFHDLTSLNRGFKKGFLRVNRQEEGAQPASSPNYPVRWSPSLSEAKVT